MALLLITACEAGVVLDAGDVHLDALVCTSGTPCTTGDRCQDGEHRCECARGALACEHLACPVAPVTTGTPCTQPGLTCDPDFELAGYRCTAPELVFVECLPGGTIETRCPYALPTVGAPCCWLQVGSTQLEPCMYAADTGGAWTCEADHWVRR